MLTIFAANYGKSKRDVQETFNPPMPEFFITREMGFVVVSIGKQIEKF